MRTEKYVIEIIRPKDVSVNEVKEFITTALNNEPKHYHLTHPCRRLSIIKVKRLITKKTTARCDQS